MKVKLTWTCDECQKVCDDVLVEFKPLDNAQAKCIYCGAFGVIVEFERDY